MDRPRSLDSVTKSAEPQNASAEQSRANLASSVSLLPPTSRRQQTSVFTSASREQLNSASAEPMDPNSVEQQSEKEPKPLFKNRKCWVATAICVGLLLLLGVLILVVVLVTAKKSASPEAEKQVDGGQMTSTMSPADERITAVSVEASHESSSSPSTMGFPPAPVVSASSMEPTFGPIPTTASATVSMPTAASATASMPTTSAVATKPTTTPATPSPTSTRSVPTTKTTVTETVPTTISTTTTTTTTTTAATTTTKKKPDPLLVIDSSGRKFRGFMLDNAAAGVSFYGDGKARVFLGIRYAQTDSSSLYSQRYGPSSGITGVKMANEDAKKFGDYCPQMRSSTTSLLDAGLMDPSKVSGGEVQKLKMSDDCLTLNVFAPVDEEQDGLYPVYVHMHGGFLARGSSAELGLKGIIRNLVSKGIVVVTLNYRLGPSGFFDAPEIEGDKWAHDGNRGFFDQIRALEYIKKNIKSFGGDPDSITVGGYNAGACFVDLMASSRGRPEIASLFHRVILQSGSSELCTQNAFRIQKQSSSQNFAEKRCYDVNWESYQGSRGHSDAVSLKKCLESLSLDDMSELSEDILTWEPTPQQNDDKKREAPKEGPNPRKLDVLIGVSDVSFASFDHLLRSSSSDFFPVIDKADISGEHYVEQALERLCYEWNGIRFDTLKEQISKTYSDVLDGLQGTQGAYLRLYYKAMTDALISSRIANRAKELARDGCNVYVYRFEDSGSELISWPLSAVGDDYSYEGEESHIFMPEHIWSRSGGPSKSALASSDSLANHWAEFIKEGKLSSLGSVENDGSGILHVAIGKNGGARTITSDEFLKPEIVSFWTDIKKQVGINV